MEDVHSEYQVLTQYNNLTTNQVLKKVLQVHANTMSNLAKLAAAIAVIPVSTAGICMANRFLKNLYMYFTDCNYSMYRVIMIMTVHHVKSLVF